MDRTHQTSIRFVLAALITSGLWTQPLLWARSQEIDAPIHILSSDGFVRNWLILGPFPNPKDKLSSRDSGYQTDYLQSLGGEARVLLTTGKHAQSFDRLVNKGQSCLYWLYLPEEYGKKNQKWPMILFLHGSFQQGRDLSRISTPIPPNIEDIKNDFPFVVVTPQCPDEYDAWPSDLLVDLVDEIVIKYNVDARRVYATGLSLGGRGTWSVAVDYPERFAAIVPVCGTYGHPERISRIKDVPVWAFHGDQDKVVLFSEVKKMVEDVKACGGKVTFTIYQGAGHNIAGKTYRNKELYEWLLQQCND